MKTYAVIIHSQDFCTLNRRHNIEDIINCKAAHHHLCTYIDTSNSSYLFLFTTQNEEAPHTVHSECYLE